MNGFLALALGFACGALCVIMAVWLGMIVLGYKMWKKS